MKLIAKMLHAFDRATTPQASAATGTGAQHTAEVCPTRNDVTPAVSPDKSSRQVKDAQQVTIRLIYAGEDTKYLKVVVGGGKTLKIAKSRIQFVLEGVEVIVTMTKRYAASRPELVEQ